MFREIPVYSGFSMFVAILG